MSTPDLALDPLRARSETGPFAAAPATARSEWIDALRGFALLGIALYNIQVFSGFSFRGLVPHLQPIGAAFDPTLDFIAHVLIQGKFYSLFSFLFGLGLALQFDSATARGEPAAARLRRRLGWLLVIGLVHAGLVWFGDILTNYAVLGFALLLFLRLSTRALLAWALFFLALPVLVYPLLWAAGMGDPLAGNPGTPLQESPVFKLVSAITSTSYADVAQLQLQFLPAGWIRRAAQLALPRIFGMFLLGVWAARIGLPALRDAQRPMLRRWLVLGLLLGLPLNIGFSLLGGNESLYPAGAMGLLSVALSSLGLPLLCLAIVAAFALYWRAPRPRSLLVAAGRTGLSHYLGQSVLFVGLFYGMGMGLFGRVGYGIAILIALGVFLALAIAGRWWLQRFAQGPVEALWRRLSVGRTQPARA